ncbi:PhoH family protein [bacterium]|nr:MAG: PhoH family protein [bacterium]
MEKLIKLNNIAEAQALFGLRDENLFFLEEALGVTITLRAETLKISGEGKLLKKALPFIEHILGDIRQGKAFDKEKIKELIPSFKEQRKNPGPEEEKLDIGFSFKGKTIGPKTRGQQEYIQAIKEYDIVFAVGPAGTGKTYLAMAMAVEALRKGYVRRIILTRPALEAGESLGYLPGTLYEKILPYLRPLYDALYDMMEAKQIEQYIEVGTIEVAPLAFMRGRTLNDAFVILDEAQNCTVEQLKMFLTRLGFDSKTVITGDITQSDLPGGKPSGLLLALDILKPVTGIKFARFSGKDVVRHELVQRIIEAYEKSSAKTA